jgi:hypothetical protein
LKGESPTRWLATRRGLPVSEPPGSDLRRVRLLGTRTPLQPLPKENQLMALTISDIALVFIAVALFLIWLFGVNVTA